MSDIENIHPITAVSENGEVEFEPFVQIIAFCENIIKDQSNRFSLINIYDQISVEEMPANIAVSAFLSMVLFQGKYILQIRSIAPDKKTVELSKYEFIKPMSGVHSLVMHLNISFSLFGVYEFEMYINDKLLTKTKLTINVIAKSES